MNEIRIDIPGNITNDHEHRQHIITIYWELGWRVVGGVGWCGPHWIQLEPIGPQSWLCLCFTSAPQLSDEQQVQRRTEVRTAAADARRLASVLKLQQKVPSSRVNFLIFG